MLSGGYLTGRLKAYEGEDALKKLIDQRIRNGSSKLSINEVPLSGPYDIEKLDKVELIKIIGENEQMIFKSTPIENGTKRPDHLGGVTGKLHPSLRLVIPMRDDDNSVPEFVQKFDYTVEHYGILKRTQSKKQNKVNPKNNAYSS